MASSDRDRNERHKIASSVKHIPKDAQVIMSILKELGINDYEHRVINQLLEFTYRYVTCILDDAKIFANHAKKKMIDLDDVKIASEMILDKTFTSPPPREVLLELARSRSAPLPPIKPHCGLRLPPDRYCLIAANYKLRPSSNAKKVLSKSALPTPFDNRGATNKPPFPSKVTSSSSSVFQSPTTTNVTSKRPPISIANKTQTVTVPKPVFKFSTTPKTTPSTGNIKPPDVKVAVDDDGIVVSGIKRKRDDDDEFETV